jgi:O-antigen/teichoic acid export membrane protein
LVLRAEEKSNLYSAVRVGRFLLELLLNIVFVVYLKKGVLGILYANLLASLINLLALTPFQLKYLRGSFDWPAFKTLAAFALPMLPNGLAYLTVEVSEKYLMRLLLDKDTLGIYAPNYKFGSLLLLVVMAFRTAWQPFFLRIAKEEENPQRIYARVLTYFFLIGSFIVVTGSYFVEYIVKLPLGGGRTLLGHAYWSGIVIIPLILTAYLFYGLYVNFTVGIYIKKKTQWMVLFTGLAAVANVGSNFYLMPHFGIMGAAVATLLSYVVMTLAIWLVNRRLYPIRYEYGRLSLVLLYLTGMLFVLYYFNPGFGLRLILILLSPALFLAGGFLKKEELQVLKQWRK